MTIGERTGATNLYQTYQKLGLFQKTGIDLPGEANSIMHKLSDIGPVELATMSFGQSFQISPIQFVTAAATVINGGNKITPPYRYEGGGCGEPGYDGASISGHPRGGR